MYFGSRNIRSAGRTSGSVEITLPVELAVLKDIPCRLHLRDGLGLEIVLEPDLRAVGPIFEKLWALLALGFEEIAEIGDFDEADYGFGLFRASKLGTAPSLAYADALVIHRSLGSETEPTPQALEAFAGIVESMAAVAGARLGLSKDLAALFGSQVAYCVSGEAIGGRDAFARGLASPAANPSLGEAGWCRRAPLDAASWKSTRSGLACLYDQFSFWNRDPDLFARERARWYRARRFEARLGATSR